jgi:hypothetical protein
MAEKKKILYIVEAMGGGVFTYIVDLANELVNKYDMYIAYAVRKQTPKNYKDYFDKRIHLIEVKNFGRAINPTKDIAAFFEVKKIAAEVKPDVIHLHSSKAGAIGRVAFDGKIPMFYKSTVKCLATTCEDAPTAVGLRELYYIKRELHVIKRDFLQSRGIK